MFALLSWRRANSATKANTDAPNLITALGYIPLINLVCNLYHLLLLHRIYLSIVMQTIKLADGNGSRKSNVSNRNNGNTKASRQDGMSKKKKDRKHH